MGNEKTVYRGIDTLFYNSQCLFVEYHDVIAMPWLTLITFIKSNDNISEYFDMDKISDYTLEGLVEWYVYRKERNPLKEIGYIEDEISDSAYDEILHNFLVSCPDIFNIDTNLRFMSTLRMLLSEPGLVKKVIIYSEKEEMGIQTVLDYYFDVQGKMQYMCGEFKDILNFIPSDSTYVLSDIEKVRILNESDKLNYSCILIPNGLRYNYEKEDPTKLKVDLDGLEKDHIFKYSFFNNFDMTDVLKTENINGTFGTEHLVNLQDITNSKKNNE